MRSIHNLPFFALAMAMIFGPQADRPLTNSSIGTLLIGLFLLQSMRKEDDR